MGLNIAVNIITSGFLVTTFLFFLLTGIVFFYAYSKVGQILQSANTQEDNDLNTLNSALSYLKTAYILVWIAAALTLLLAFLYAGHELAFSPSEWIHMVIYLAIYVLLVVGAIYAFIALNKINSVGVTFKNGADGYIWAGLLMALFAFMALTASGSGRIGMNAVRSNATHRLNQAEHNVNEHLPAIRHQVETHLPTVRQKVDQLHAKACGLTSAVKMPVSCSTTCMTSPRATSPAKEYPSPSLAEMMSA